MVGTKVYKTAFSGTLSSGGLLHSDWLPPNHVIAHYHKVDLISTLLDALTVQNAPRRSRRSSQSRYNCRSEISKMGRELQKWAEPPKWGGVSSRKDFHHWLWLQPIVIDLHFKITLYKLKIVSSLSKINQYSPWEQSPKLVVSGVRTGVWTSA